MQVFAVMTVVNLAQTVNNKKQLLVFLSSQMVMLLFTVSGGKTANSGVVW